MSSVKNLFITGTPGVGKTTLIKECVYPYLDFVGGFFTEEMKVGNERDGFRLKALSGKEGILAKKGMKSPHKLNKYGLDMDVLEKIGVNALRDAQQTKKIVVVDEIGTMEMMSGLFCQTITELLSGETPVLATIREKAEPFTSQIKKMDQTELIHFERDDFPHIKEKIRNWIEEKIG